MAPPRKNDIDILQRFFDQLQTNLANTGLQLPPEVRERTDLQLRAELGGDRHYLPKASSVGKQLRLSAALRSGASISEAMAKAEVSRAQGYRILKRHERWA